MRREITRERAPTSVARRQCQPSCDRCIYVDSCALSSMWRVTFGRDDLLLLIFHSYYVLLDNIYFGVMYVRSVFWKKFARWRARSHPDPCHRYLFLVCQHYKLTTPYQWIEGSYGLKRGDEYFRKIVPENYTRKKYIMREKAYSNFPLASLKFAVSWR